MKKTLRTLMLFFVVALISGLATSCGSDDDDEPADPTTHDQALIGTWVSEEQGSDWWEKTELTVYANGQWKLYGEAWDEEYGREKYWSEGTWETSNNKLYITQTNSSHGEDDGESFVSDYSVSGNYLYLDGEKYTKK
ncbi:MAG: hypothetical protein HDS12_06030 [Bacteroides sp.]|nr:hypothetical protein [Bacteroides sp.]